MSTRTVRPAATQETPCNLCGARHYIVVGTSDRDGEPLQTVLCRTCGLVWTNPRPEEAAIDAYYATLYRADYKGHAAPPLRKIVRGFAGAVERRALLREVLKKSGESSRTTDRRLRMIDVGSGAGELVFLMRRDGVDASGLEPGLAFAEVARTVLKVPIETATVERAVVLPDSQDVVTMFHALEHVADPRRVLTIVRKWIGRGGHLVIEVPNIEAGVQAPSHLYHFAHLHHFTGSSLAALGEAAGFRHVETRYTPDRGNVIAILRRGDDDAERPPSGLEGAAARTLDALTTHTAVRHYFSTVPYARVFGRFRRRREEDRLLARIRSVEDAVRWAETL